MIVALLLALVSVQPSTLPDPAKDYPAYVAYTGGQFVCDDQPYSKGCGNEAERRRLIRFFIRDGGYSRQSAEEVVNWPLDRLMAQAAAVKECGPEDVTDTFPPRCNRKGYTVRAHRYEAAACSDRDYLALRCGGAGDAYEKDICSEVDHPRACVLDHRRHELWVDKVCGTSGANDDDGVNVSCDETAWDWRHRRYVPMCGTRWSAAILADKALHRPRPGDPWVRWYRLQGRSANDARVTRADDVVNGCDD